MELITRPYLQCCKEERNALHDFYAVIKTYCNDTHDCKNCPFREICCEDTAHEYLGDSVNVPEVIYAILDCLKL